jgi:hypothetical protein
MFWKLFGSEERVQQAIEQSVGYDISPNILHQPEVVQPAVVVSEGTLDLWKDYAFVMPANADNVPYNGPRERKKA